MNVRLSAYSIAFLFLLVPIAGCMGQDGSIDADNDEGMFDCDNGNQVPMGSVNDGVDDCGDYSDEKEGDMEPVQDVNLPVITIVPNQAGCDNLNPHHCMLPFPSDAFLVEDTTTTTGLRVHYPAGSIPASGSVDTVEIPRINQLDGMSTASQIMTTFDEVPDLQGVAYQYDIERSMEADHATIIWNLDDDVLVAHWVELDARAQDGEQTIVHLRTAAALEHDTAYMVVIRGLNDQNGEPIQPSAALKALIEGEVTNAEDIENRRAAFNGYFDVAENQIGVDRGDIQALWSFHTASVESVIGPILSMRDDALQRIGDGLGCTINPDGVEDNFGGDGMIYRRVRGTFTAPQYLLEDRPPTMLSRDSSYNPIFVENREVPFTLIIPMSLYNSTEPGALTVFGHGFLGTGEGHVSSGLREWGEIYETALLATDFYGWSSDDHDGISMGIMDGYYFTHQSDRLQQAMVNHVVMIRTFKGICSELPEMQDDNGRLLVNTSEVYYTGYSLGGNRGASLLGLSPDVSRGALWVGGAAFSHQIERCTQYDQFDDLMESVIGYPSQLDRAVVISIIQSLWDATDTNTWSTLSNGLEGRIDPYEMLYIGSIGDLQISNISTSRALRNADASILSSSSILPYGMPVVEGGEGATGNIGVYFDGGFSHAPEENLLGQEPHPAHNWVAGVEAAHSMAFGYLYHGFVEDRCEGSCIYDAD